MPLIGTRAKNLGADERRLSKGALFTEAEFAENDVEDVLGMDVAGDQAKRIRGGGDVDDDDLRRHRGERGGAGGGK